MWLGDPYRDDMPCEEAYTEEEVPCAPPVLPLLREDQTEILAPLGWTVLDVSEAQVGCTVACACKRRGQADLLRSMGGKRHEKHSVSASLKG